MEDFLYKFLNLFNHLPLPVKRVFGWLYNVLPKRLKYGSYYYKYTRRLNYFESIKSFEESVEAQQHILFKQVNKAIDHIPFYANYNKAHGIKDFLQYPVINKKIIQDSFTDLTGDQFINRRLKANTGGSSGTPMEFYIEKNVSRPKEKAHFDWYWKQFGYLPKSRMLMIRGLPLPNNRTHEYNSINNILNVSCYNINEGNISLIIKKINQFNPRFIHAYPSSLKIITSLLESHREKLDFSIEAAFLGSEQLFESDRNYFEEFYRTKVVNWYGHSERLVHGGNCPFTNEYHFYPAYGYMELLDENDDVINEPGQEGRIVATGFDNSVMPFIRYDTGDFGVLSGKTECTCGFKGVSLEHISGRGQDFIILADQTKVSLTAFIFGQHLEAFKRIREMQVVQSEVGKIELKIVRNEAFTLEDEKSLKMTLIDSVDHKIKVNFDYVETLPKTARGKNIFFVSKINAI